MTLDFANDIVVLLRRAALEIEQLRSVHSRCKWCGAPLHQNPTSKTRFFCSPKCRSAHSHHNKGISK